MTSNMCCLTSRNEWRPANGDESAWLQSNRHRLQRFQVSGIVCSLSTGSDADLTQRGREVPGFSVRRLELFLLTGIVQGPDGSEIILDDPSGNPIELFQPAH
jgi:hypothetical protein